MKKTLLSLSLLAITSSHFAQQNFNEVAPPSASGIPTVVSERSLWNIQLDTPPTAIAAGLAGACWTGTELWVSRWGVDSLWTLNASGAIIGSPFVIAGITGTRGISTDGTNIYIGANTNIIYKVNPVTKTVISSITTSVTNCRYVAYDPTLNAGAGGIWTGTFATDITAVSLSGATLSAITAATHGLTGIYGMAYDPYSTGGPYLWAYDQGAAGTSAILTQLTMAGVPTGLVHDTQLDLAGGSNTGIAGGAFITNSMVSGQKTLGGIDQGVSIFAYELSDPSGIQKYNNEDFKLAAYPNPSSSSSTISFELKVSDKAGLEVYNLLGKKVYAIAAEQMAAGKHTLTIDEKELVNGCYFVKLNVGNQASSIKINILK